MKLAIASMFTGSTIHGLASDRAKMIASPTAPEQDQSDINPINIASILKHPTPIVHTHLKDRRAN